MLTLCNAHGSWIPCQCNKDDAAGSIAGLVTWTPPDVVATIIGWRFRQIRRKGRHLVDKSSMVVKMWTA
eukprot:6278449-Amphidinium_carterae.1